MYYKEIIDTIIGVLSRFKGVNYVKYQGDDLNNQQHNHKTLQCYIDNVSFSEYNLTTNVNKMSFEVYILGFPDDTSGNTILDVQDVCYNVAVNFLAYIDNAPQFYNLITLADWSILTLDRYTAQNNAGVKLSVILNAVSPINLCEIQDWFNDEPYSGDTDTQITISGGASVNDELTITPIKLPKKK